jgi:hypothetical protein
LQVAKDEVEVTFEAGQFLSAAFVISFALSSDEQLTEKDYRRGRVLSMELFPCGRVTFVI